MSIKFTWELYFDMPKWVDKIHDFVWEDTEDDNE
jgi:hypothetical protein